MSYHDSRYTRGHLSSLGLSFIPNISYRPELNCIELFFSQLNQNYRLIRLEHIIHQQQKIDTPDDFGGAQKYKKELNSFDNKAVSEVVGLARFGDCYRSLKRKEEKSIKDKVKN